VWITTNYEALAQALVQKYKFGHLRAAAQPITRLMADTLPDFWGADQNYLLIPVPTATSRIRQRGFGHSELLAKRLAANLRMEHAQALRRLDQTRQLGSARQDRLTQLADSFVARSRHRVHGRKILLIDDVITTGGTLIAAANTLKAAGAAQVNALVFAKRL
jgi:ComF family protein